MTIYTRAAYTTTQGICEGGMERTQATLDKLGLTMDSDVSMQLIMRELGLLDTLYSFCKVCTRSEAEAERVIRQYCLFVGGKAAQWLALTHSDMAEMIAAANRALNLRFSGKDNTKMRRTSLAAWTTALTLNADSFNIVERQWVEVYRCLLTDKIDAFCATHATVALLEGARLCGMWEEVHARLCQELNQLLGPEV